MPLIHKKSDHLVHRADNSSRPPFLCRSRPLFMPRNYPKRRNGGPSPRETKASASGIVPFARRFPREIEYMIISHLGTSDLRSCSLIDYALGDGAARYLWTAVIVSRDRVDSPDLVGLINSIIMNTRRASAIRKLSLKDIPNSLPPRIITDKQAEDEETLKFLALFYHSMNQLSRITTLELRFILNLFAPAELPISFLAILARTSMANQLTTLIIPELPLEHAIHLCRAMPSLRTLSIAGFLPKTIDAGLCPSFA
ncbi:hypothetical protein DL93DRAFT_719537 [Clavulina sp. PMI_390]|nr:hypothetical protein DL93DRAFT_719537 [Clavulina sp. PMI_390]